jgi:hypothetical protein
VSRLSLLGGRVYERLSVRAPLCPEPVSPEAKLDAWLSRLRPVGPAREGVELRPLPRARDPGLPGGRLCYELVLTYKYAAATATATATRTRVGGVGGSAALFLTFARRAACLHAPVSPHARACGGSLVFFARSAARVGRVCRAGSTGSMGS